MPNTPVNILPKEQLSRYILSKRHFSREKNEVKYALFMPPSDLKFSVFRTSNLNDQRIWDIGKEIVAAPQGRTLKGRGDLKVLDVLDGGLEVMPFAEPHELHAHIIGWPNQETKQRVFAAKLALKATLTLLPE